MKRSTKRFLEFLPTLVGMLLLMPFYLIYLAIAEPIGRRRMGKDAEIFQCQNCDAFLGKRSLDLADEYWNDYMREMRARFPGCLLRVVRTVQAICPQCGTMYDYKRSIREFVVREGPDDLDANER